jgi:hypothetical protein
MMVRKCGKKARRKNVKKVFKNIPEGKKIRLKAKKTESRTMLK